MSGDAQVSSNSRVEDIAKRSVYETNGLVIETKKTESKTETGRNYSTMVYSNGTAAFFSEDTRVEVRKFEQEPFKADRTDMSIEPSISKTDVFVARGTVALSTSELVAGSSMIYETKLGSVNIRGRKVVIETDDDETTISMLDGESTVQAGGLDMGGHVIKAGEEAVIRPGGPGQPNIIEIRQIPPVSLTLFDDMVSNAVMAQKTVYFEVKGPAASSGSAVASQSSGGSAEKGTSASTDDASVTAFDAVAANNSNASSSSTRQQIIPVQVVPVSLPVQFTISPARLITPGK